MGILCTRLLVTQHFHPDTVGTDNELFQSQSWQVHYKTDMKGLMVFEKLYIVRLGMETM